MGFYYPGMGWDLFVDARNVAAVGKRKSWQGEEGGNEILPIECGVGWSM